MILRRIDKEQPLEFKFSKTNPIFVELASIFILSTLTSVSSSSPNE